jgi:hypothetical protein
MVNSRRRGRRADVIEQFRPGGWPDLTVDAVASLTRHLIRRAEGRDRSRIVERISGGIEGGRPESGGYEALLRTAPDRPSPRVPKCGGYGHSAGIRFDCFEAYMRS